MPYTHYRLTLPNNEVRMKLSGNYLITVYDDSDTSKPVFKTCFRVLDKQVSVSATVSSDTEIDRNKGHQQVSFNVRHRGYNIRNPQQEVKIQVMQNGRTDNMVTVFNSMILIIMRRCFQAIPVPEIIVMTKTRTDVI